MPSMKRCFTRSASASRHHHALRAGHLHRHRAHIPSACTTFNAGIAESNGIVPAVAGLSLDSARIQSAIDHCAANHAVVLRAHGAHNVFLTGPIALRPGVTLVVDATPPSSPPAIFDLAQQAKITDKGQSVPALSVLHHADTFTLYNITLRNSSVAKGTVSWRDGWWD